MVLSYILKSEILAIDYVEISGEYRISVSVKSNPVKVNNYNFYKKRDFTKERESCIEQMFPMEINKQNISEFLIIKSDNI
mgnify:CR=1 FL=1